MSEFAPNPEKQISALEQELHTSPENIKQSVPEKFKDPLAEFARIQELIKFVGPDFSLRDLIEALKKDGQLTDKELMLIKANLQFDYGITEGNA